jgi:hypothetical protein
MTVIHKYPGRTVLWAPFIAIYIFQYMSTDSCSIVQKVWNYALRTNQLITLNATKGVGGFIERDEPGKIAKRKK